MLRRPLPPWWFVQALFIAATPTVPAVTIQGMGTTVPSHVYLDSPFSYSFVQPATQVQYYARESRAGLCRLTDPAAECDPQDTDAPTALDFAASTAILSQADYAKFPDLQMYPTLAAAIVPIYNLNGAQGLILSKVVLAQIFSGRITAWDDAHIQQLNPNFTRWRVPANQSINVVVRQERSDVTTVFKRALAAFWPTFAAWVNVTESTAWGNLTPTPRQGYEGVNTYVLQSPWTISYSVYGDARDFYVPMARLLKAPNVVVEASMDSTAYAVLEMGLNFGNTGDDPGRLTADLSNAQGVNAWPIVTYTYVVLRKATLRPGATCEHVAQTAAYWYWFYTADAMDAVTNRHFFVRLPNVARDIVVQRLVTDVTCLGRPVVAVPNATVLRGLVDPTVASMFEQLVGVYPIVHPDVTITYAEGQPATVAEVRDALAARDFATVRRPALSPPGTATFIFAGLGLAVISQYNVVLDAATLLGILEGDIRTWLHPALSALNPGGITDQDGAPITDANQSIVLFNGPVSGTTFFLDLMQALAPSFTGKALYAAPRQAVDEVLRYFVAGTPYSLSVTPFIGEFSSRLNFASFRRSDGRVIAPSSASLLACASPDVYSPASNYFDMKFSANGGCYPLADTIYLTVPKPSCVGLQEGAEPPVVDFLVWLFRNATWDAALAEQRLAPLRAASAGTVGANVAAVRFLSCNAEASSATSSVDLVPIIVGACFGGLFGLSIPFGWYLWKSTKDMRALRKQFSDATVAQECAEAIASFDLDAVAWLAAVHQPSKIQQAFLNIIGLLTEVKPFIPDQLLAQLQARHRPADSSRDPRPGQARTDDTRALSERSPSSATSGLTNPTGPPESPLTPGDAPRHSLPGFDGPRRAPGAEPLGRRPGRASPLHPRALLAAGTHGDRVRRTCTYMFTRFRWSGDPDDEAAGTMAALVTAHVVTAAKAHGATIDKVMYDSVALHWNVALAAAGAPLRAATLALELLQTKAVLPPEWQPALQLLIGVGHGVCTVATVSAAGQRFFVVGGQEVNAAMEVVMRDLAVPLGSHILVTNAMQQEVQYAFRCFPRLWYRDVLMWEPVEARRTSRSDEWMYELQHMQAKEEGYSGKVLQGVFLLASSPQSSAAVQEEIRKVERLYGAQMSPQDVASLRLLSKSLGCHDLVVSCL